MQTDDYNLMPFLRSGKNRGKLRLRQYEIVPVRTGPPSAFMESSDEMDDQEEFERLVGGPDNGFRMMRLWTSAQQSASGNKYRLNRSMHVNPVASFVKRAKQDGFNARAIKFYVTQLKGEKMPTSKEMRGR